MTADELREAIAATDRGESVTAGAMMEVNQIPLADMYAVCTAAGVECLKPGMSGREIVRRVRQRLTARERAELRNYC